MPLGHDGDGDPISSCVPVDIDHALPSLSAQPVFTVRQTTVIELVANWPNASMGRADLLMRYRQRFPTKRCKDCADVIKQLQEKGVLDADRDQVWLVADALVLTSS